MSYTATSNGDGSYIVKQGDVVLDENVRAKKVSFSHITSHTLQGDIHHIAGPCIITVSVPGKDDIEATIDQLAE